MHLEACEQISFKFGMMVVTTELDTLLLVLMTLTFHQDHMGKKKQKLQHQLSQSLQSVTMKVDMVLGLGLNILLDLFCLIDIQIREHH